MQFWAKPPRRSYSTQNAVKNALRGHVHCSKVHTVECSRESLSSGRMPDFRKVVAEGQ